MTRIGDFAAARFTALCIAALGLEAPAAAQTAPTPAAPAVEIDRETCRDLKRHRGDDAAYVPGVDVRGRPVAPADLGGAQAAPAIARTIRIPLTVDLTQYGVPADSPLFDPSAAIGEITIDSFGQARMNGTPIGSASAGGLAVVCAQAWPDLR